MVGALRPGERKGLVPNLKGRVHSRAQAAGSLVKSGSGALGEMILGDPGS